jgi:hypothetical protein
MAEPANLVGQKFGDLTVVRRAESKNWKGRWYCVCVCGGKTIVITSLLRTGATKNCGCRRHKPPANRTHAMSETPEYEAWRGMKRRCLNPHRRDYQHYGGRGIGICERWMKFENFFADMGSRPPGASLDRINVDAS